MLAPVSLSSLPSLPSPLSSPLPKHASPALHLVLLPGMDGTGQLFAPLLAALQDLTPELPVSVVPYSDQLPTDQQLQVSLHHRLKHGAKTVILAESFSGHVLTRLLHNWPAQLGPQPIGLVMAGSFVRNPQRWAGPLRAVARAVLPPILPPLMQVVTRDSRDSPAPSPHPLLRTLARVLYGPQPAPEHCAALRNALAQVPPAPGKRCACPHWCSAPSATNWCRPPKRPACWRCGQTASTSPCPARMACCRPSRWLRRRRLWVLCRRWPEKPPSLDNQGVWVDFRQKRSVKKTILVNQFALHGQRLLILGGLNKPIWRLSARAKGALDRAGSGWIRRVPQAQTQIQTQTEA